MRGIFIALAAFVALGPAAARAQEAITLRADPVPIVAARINGRDVRLEVDTSLPDVVVLSTATAERLGLRNVPFTRVVVAVGEARLRGRIARPSIVFADGARARAFAGVFPVPVSTRADGVIGPGVLPHERVTIEFGAAAGGRDINFTLDDPDVWQIRTEIAPGVFANADASLSRPLTVINRAVVRDLEAARLLEPAGDLAEREFLLGLTTSMQPVDVAASVTVGGVPLGRSLAFTGAPVLGASEENAVIVEAEGEGRVISRVTLGRDALAGCSAVSVNRAARRMTWRCS